MSANNSLLLICGFVVFTTSAVLLARFQFFELFTISANESYTLPAGSNMQQRVKIVSESREVRLFFPQAMSSRLVKVIVQQDNDDAPGEDISTKIVQPHRESSRSSLRIKIPRTPAEHIWISIASADGEPIEVFREIDSTKYSEGRLMLNNKKIAGVLGFSLVERTRFPLHPRLTAIVFGLLLIVWISVAPSISKRVV